MPRRFAKEPTGAATAPRRLFFDNAARWIVTAGGLAIIASILGILVFLLIETVPLVRSARVAAWNKIDLGSDRSILAVACDPYQEHVATLDDTGRVRAHRIADGKVVETKQLLDGNTSRKVAAAKTIRAGKGFAVATSDGHIIVQPIAWEVGFEGDARVVTPDFGEATSIQVDESGRATPVFAATLQDEGSILIFAQTAGSEGKPGGLVWAHQEREWNEFAEEWEGDLTRQELDLDGTLTHVLLNPEGREAFGVTTDRRLVWWKRAAANELFSTRVISAGDERVTAMGFLFGSRAFVLGTETGNVSVWFPSNKTGEPRLTNARSLPSLENEVTLLSHSQRNQSFVAADLSGRATLFYATTSKQDWQSEPIPDLGAIALAPKMDAVLAARKGEVWIAQLDHPHPEASIAAFAGKIWYEGYEGPTYTYESTGGTDDFESKLSLIPLVFGTLKGTLFAMLLSIPLAVLGAMFVSQFLHPTLRDYIKPAIEIMAAMPSVILGFIAALWLAPLLEIGFCAFLLMPLFMPIFVILAGMAWMRLPLRIRARCPTGSEALLFVVVLSLAIWLCIALNQPVERLLFGGDFPAWIYETLGVTYEQKNSVVIAIAMSFAVIPIIFTISEDAFSNVPRTLVSGSLALGANRWQTVTRVVLPTASPGIFSATMVGFGRAVGETMIVLMATGNTAVMDINPFNGFRTLSANIAVEIPEAPHGDTLYRTLFLAALILFVLTFAINTLAEVVRQRLRRRYASL